MNIMKNVYKKISSRSTVLILIILFVASCSKGFLELDPQQSVSTENALSNIGDFRAAITGVYDGMSSSNYYGRYFVLVSDIMSDDVKPNASANRAADWCDYAGSSTDNNALSENIWQQGYIVINRANRVILTDITVVPVLQDEYDHIKGQAYAARALAHFDLSKIYAQHYTYTAGATHMGVPIIMDLDPFGKPARATLADVYTQVIADFNMALTMMDPMEDDPYKLTYLGVKALLSRVYLYMEDYQNAYNMANDVIASAAYDLVDNADYGDIFDIEASDESIFEIDKNEADNSGSDALGGMYINTGYGDYLPTTELMDLYPVGDAREAMFLEDLSIGGGAYGTMRVDKYGDLLGYDNTKVVRLSEMYLNRAEAGYYLAGVTDAAVQADVDAIRQRGLPAAPAVTATGAALLDEILLERRLELCYEGHRLFDLMRYKMDLDRTDCTSQASACFVAYPDNRFILAIGQYEIDVNENIVQNPGYEISTE